MVALQQLRIRWEKCVKQIKQVILSFGESLKLRQWTHFRNEILGCLDVFHVEMVKFQIMDHLNVLLVKQELVLIFLEMVVIIVQLVFIHQMMEVLHF